MSVIPPIVIDVRVKEAGSRGFRIWLPLFLLWPLLLVLAALAMTVSLVVDVLLFIAGARYHSFTLLLVRTMQLISQLRGTHADIASSDSTTVNVHIY